MNPLGLLIVMLMAIAVGMTGLSIRDGFAAYHSEEPEKTEHYDQAFRFARIGIVFAWSSFGLSFLL